MPASSVPEATGRRASRAIASCSAWRWYAAARLLGGAVLRLPRVGLEIEQSLGAGARVVDQLAAAVEAGVDGPVPDRAGEDGGLARRAFHHREQAPARERAVEVAVPARRTGPRCGPEVERSASAFTRRPAIPAAGGKRTTSGTWTLSSWSWTLWPIQPCS